MTLVSCVFERFNLTSFPLVVNTWATWPARERSDMHPALQKVCTSHDQLSTLNPNFFYVFVFGYTSFYPDAPPQVAH